MLLLDESSVNCQATVVEVEDLEKNSKLQARANAVE